MRKRLSVCMDASCDQDVKWIVRILIAQAMLSAMGSWYFGFHDGGVL